MLRFLERVHERGLSRTGRWIADEERRQAEQRQGEQARPSEPDWFLEFGLKQDSAPVSVHAGGCWNVAKRSRGVPRDAALRALAEGVAACPQCRPNAELGYLG
ncbi:hypothetical protein AQJ66_24500 [Streptomyces bungoensis]|uniref:Uncharacterized protein n=1 Tax=Streptomyces bungoensis TaxID=285568 RepID=A0A101SVX9_9ACTN|nr:DUF6233 domain-containing protein [Streptomyces bungoensis]KUN81127.1 hypothetical protein AQJ66_24500 [Streptomyces bungoensis]